MSRMTPALVLPIALALLPGSALAQDAGTTHAEQVVPSPAAADPANPAAKVPNVQYRSAWSDYRSFKEEKPAPWDQVGAELSGAPSAAGGAGHRMQSMTGPSAQPNAMGTEDRAARPAGDASATTAPAVASDTRGVIQAINRTEGKVKLKHGPLPKLSMPPMTMVYRVRDPKLLEQIKEGDEVGVTVEQVGDAFVITGFQK